MTGIKKFNTKLFFVGQAALFLIIAIVLISSNASYAAVPGTHDLVSADYQNAPLTGGINSYASSADGNYAVFSTSTNGVVNMTYVTPLYEQLYLRNLKTNTTTLISKTSSGSNANNASVLGAISENGRYVLYKSRATDLLSSSITYSGYQAYLYDRVADTNVLVSQNSSGVIANENVMGAIGVSNDGRFVYFSSYATNLGPTMTRPASDMAYYTQVFVKDMLLNTIAIASQNNSLVNANGYEVSAADNVATSCDGAFLVLSTNAANMDSSNNGSTTQIYLIDMRRGHRVISISSGANARSLQAAISCNGNYIAYISKASNLVSGVVNQSIDHVYLYDRVAGTTSIVDKTSSGSISTGGIYHENRKVSVSNEGLVAFVSRSSDLTSTSINNKAQVFIKSQSSTGAELLSVTSSGTAESAGVSSPYLTLNGKKAFYEASGGVLIPAYGADGANDLVVSDTGL